MTSPSPADLAWAAAARAREAVEAGAHPHRAWSAAAEAWDAVAAALAGAAVPGAGVYLRERPADWPPHPGGGHQARPGGPMPQRPVCPPSPARPAQRPSDRPIWGVPADEAAAMMRDRVRRDGRGDDEARHAVEDVGPVGCLPSEEALPDPAPGTEADALVAAIASIAAERDALRAEWDAYGRGEQARVNGEDHDENPHRAGPRAVAWDRGWSAQDAERRAGLAANERDVYRAGIGRAVAMLHLAGVPHWQDDAGLLAGVRALVAERDRLAEVDRLRAEADISGDRP